MPAPDLPAELKAALEARLEGVSRSEAAGRAALISQNYRAGGGSGTILSEGDALAYALTRMPATYAAVTASLNALRDIKPDFAPQSLLDVGAGPGTASWAAVGSFASLHQLNAIDTNRALRSLALDLAGGAERLGRLVYRAGEANAALAAAQPADLVVASYFIGELRDADRAALADGMWAKTADTLLVVEPGTPAGHGRIMALRERLVAAGAQVAAPCPHNGRCPLIAPDWCHFNQRLPRSQAHRQVKGAALSFEDERFSYVALTRTKVVRHPFRVLAQPQISKAAIRAKLCTDRGISDRTVLRRHKADYQRFRKLEWGDAICEASAAAET